MGIRNKNLRLPKLESIFGRLRILLDKRKIKPEEFQVILNSINNNIQDTMDHSETEIPFLDILIKKYKLESGWTSTINQQTPADKYHSLQITQTIAKETYLSH